MIKQWTEGLSKHKDMKIICYHSDQYSLEGYYLMRDSQDDFYSQHSRNSRRNSRHCCNNDPPNRILQLYGWLLRNSRSTSRKEINCLLVVFRCCILLQCLFLVSCQAYPVMSTPLPVGCAWRSSISPTIPKFQTITLHACDRGMLKWYYPMSSPQLQATFEPKGSAGPFTICAMQTFNTSLSNFIQVTDKTDERDEPFSFLPGQEVCVESGRRGNVVLNFKIAKEESNDANSANEVTDNTYLVSIALRRLPDS